MMAVAFLILFNKYNFIYVIVVFGIEKLCVCVCVHDGDFSYIVSQLDGDKD